MCFLRTTAADGGLVHVTFAPLQEEARLVALSASGGARDAAPSAAVGVTAEGATTITVTAGGGGGDASVGAGCIPAGGAAAVTPSPAFPLGPSTAATPASVKVVASVLRPVCSTHTPIFTAETTSSCSSTGAAGSSTWDPLAEWHHGKGDGGGGGGGTVAAAAVDGEVRSRMEREWAGAVSTSHAMDVEMMSDAEAPAAAMAVDGGGHAVASVMAPGGGVADASPPVDAVPRLPPVQ